LHLDGDGFGCEFHDLSFCVGAELHHDAASQGRAWYYPMASRMTMIKMNAARARIATLHADSRRCAMMRVRRYAARSVILRTTQHACRSGGEPRPDNAASGRRQGNIQWCHHWQRTPQQELGFASWSFCFPFMSGRGVRPRHKNGVSGRNYKASGQK